MNRKMRRVALSRTSASKNRWKAADHYSKQRKARRLARKRLKAQRRAA